MKNKKLFKIILILFALGLLAGAVGVYYVFNKPERNIAKEEAALATSAEKLYQLFSNDEAAAYEEYGNKVLEVTGEIVEKNNSGSTLNVVLDDSMEGVSCSFDSLYIANNPEKVELLTEGNFVKIKGKCDGFDMILGVVLTKCIILSQ
jgi:hypothetical protein